MDWTSVYDGLYVSALGMIIVMAVLVLLAITVWGVSKGDAFLERRQRARETSEDESPEEVDAPAPRREREDLANVAVIAVAVALAQAQEERRQFAPAPVDSSGARGASDSQSGWVSQGRARQLTRSAAARREVWKR